MIGIHGLYKKTNDYTIKSPFHSVITSACNSCFFRNIGGIDCPVLYIRPQNRKEDPSSYINDYKTDPDTKSR